MKDNHGHPVIMKIMVQTIKENTMFYFGVDYYPEHWPEERWPEDVKLMAEANFNIVRLAEFAWSKMEPTDGQYDFDWLDRLRGRRFASPGLSPGLKPLRNRATGEIARSRKRSPFGHRHTADPL